MERALRIREMRLVAGLTQGEVAAAVGLSRQEYALVDAGKLSASEDLYLCIEAAIAALVRRHSEAVEALRARREGAAGRLRDAIQQRRRA